MLAEGHKLLTETPKLLAQLIRHLMRPQIGSLAVVEKPPRQNLSAI
jgi:hypothetical protein